MEVDNEHINFQRRIFTPLTAFRSTVNLSFAHSFVLSSDKYLLINLSVPEMKLGTGVTQGHAHP